MEIKSSNPRWTQKQIAKGLCYSDSTLKRCRIDIKMQNPQKSNDPERTQKTSNNYKRTHITSSPIIADSTSEDRSANKSVKPILNADSTNERKEIEKF